MKNIATILIPLLVLIALLLAVNIFYPVSKCVPGALSKDEAVQKAIDFINNVALQGQSAASLLETAEESGLYKIRLKIQDQEYESYVTKDAKLLFGQATKITSESQESDTGNLDFPKTDKPEVNLFVMSFCPYGNQAEELMMPVVDLLKDKADIKLHYVIYDKNYCQSLVDQKRYSNIEECKKALCLAENSNTWHCSMHGIQEVNQDVRELCVQKYQGDKFWNFVKQINASCTAQNVDTCWAGIASKAGVDVNKIKTCQKNEAIALLKSEVELGKTYSISGSPQLIINGTEFNGSRSAESFKAAICSAFNSAPKECEQTLSNEGGSATSGGCE